jgi:hypothetical protein
MLVPSAPPPYSPTTNALSQPKNIDARANRLRHFLIVILAFTYDVDFDELRKALASSSLPLSPAAHASALLLSPADLEHLTKIAEATEAVTRLVDHNQFSLITNSEWTFLVDNLLLPAKTLDVAHACIIYRLRFFCIHRLEPRLRYENYPYEGSAWLHGWRRGLRWKRATTARIRQNMVAKYIVDGMTIEKLVPDENVRELLSKALATSRENHWAWFNTSKSMERIWWSPQNLQESVVKLVEERGIDAARELGEDVEQVVT